MRAGIPKRIIQTAKTRELSLRRQAAVANVKLLNPDFEYLFFDNAEVEAFLDSEFPQYRNVFKSFRFNIQRYDFFRYLAVYRYGGFYFDMDVFLASGLSGLLGSECVFSFEDLAPSAYLREEYGMDWAIGNYAFGAGPAHPFLKAVIENCVRAHDDPDWIKPMMKGVSWISRAEFYVLNSTGPLMLCRTLAENIALAEKITILFPDDVCEKRNRHNFGELGFHLMESTWREQDDTLWKRLARRWESRTYVRFLKQSQKLGKTRSLSDLKN